MVGNEVPGEALDEACDLTIAFACDSSDIIAIGNDAPAEAPEQAWEIYFFKMFENEGPGEVAEDTCDTVIAAFPRQK